MIKSTHLIWLLIGVFSVVGCTPKTGVLRSPGQRTGTVTGKTTKENDTKKEDEPIAKKDGLLFEGSIAMVLPFQLNKMSTTVTEEDVKRSALALDFYQGFQVGLDEVVGQRKKIALHLLDSRDDENQSRILAGSQEVKEATIVVGPVYPKEIKSFGSVLNNPNVLQVNPLAATMPTEFNLPNLLSITPPISVHMRAISAKVAENYRTGDVVIIFDAANNDHRNFINGFLGDIKERLPEADVVSVSSISQLGQHLSASGTNHVVTGTTDRNQLRTLVEGMDRLYDEETAFFRLYGHPLWDRFDFSAFRNFTNYSPMISAESHLDTQSKTVRDFQNKYREKFGVAPSDHSYKGFDAGRYFGGLLDKYGDDYAQHITEETFEGLFNQYKFNKNDRWGYVNFGLNIKNYINGSFQVRR